MPSLKLSELKPDTLIHEFSYPPISKDSVDEITQDSTACFPDDFRYTDDAQREYTRITQELNWAVNEKQTPFIQIDGVINNATERDYWDRANQALILASYKIAHKYNQTMEQFKLLKNQYTSTNSDSPQKATLKNDLLSAIEQIKFLKLLIQTYKDCSLIIKQFNAFGRSTMSLETTHSDLFAIGTKDKNFLFAFSQLVNWCNAELSEDLYLALKWWEMEMVASLDKGDSTLFAGTSSIIPNENYSENQDFKNWAESLPIPPETLNAIYGQTVDYVMASPSHPDAKTVIMYLDTHHYHTPTQLGIYANFKMWRNIDQNIPIFVEGDDSADDFSDTFLKDIFKTQTQRFDAILTYIEALNSSTEKELIEAQSKNGVDSGNSKLIEKFKQLQNTLRLAESYAQKTKDLLLELDAENPTVSDIIKFLQYQSQISLTLTTILPNIPKSQFKDKLTEIINSGTLHFSILKFLMHQNHIPFQSWENPDLYPGTYDFNMQQPCENLVLVNTRSEIAMRNIVTSLKNSNSDVGVSFIGAAHYQSIKREALERGDVNIIFIDPYDWPTEGPLLP